MGEAARYAEGAGRGLRPGGAAGRLRRTGALAGACALALLGGAATAPAAQAGARTAAVDRAVAAAPGKAAAKAPDLPGASKASADYPVTVSISSVSPTYLTGGSAKVTVTGTLANGGRKPVHDVRTGVRTGTGRPLVTRSELAAVAARTDPVSGDGQELPGIGGKVADLAPGASRQFRISVSASELHLSANGVYELAVDVRGSADAAAETLGIARTFLPYYPSQGDTRKTRIATVWPVTHTPDLVPQTYSDSSHAPVLRSDDLAAELGVGGRLNEVVTAGSSLQHVTWAVDGDVLDTASAMSKPYRVQQADTAGDGARPDNTEAGAGGDRAGTWLAMLRDAVKNDEVVALPYGDPDLASIAHNGSGVQGLTTALSRASSEGSVTTDFLLQTDSRNDVAWPYQGYVDRQVAATSRLTGGKIVLVNGDSMPTSESVQYTVNAVRSIGKGQKALVSDPTVSDIFQGSLSSRESQTLAVQRFLAETLTITLEQPSHQRSILVLPPRDLSAGAADALAKALNDASAGHWAEQAGLGTVAAASADGDANTKVPAPTKYPEAARATELSHRALAAAMGSQGQLQMLMGVLSSPDAVREPFGQAILRGMSTSWRTHRGTGRAYREGVAAYLKTLTTAVRLVEKRENSTTLSGDSGTIQVSVENGLNQPVSNLEVRLSTQSATRLSIYRPDPAQLTIGGELKKSVRFPAKASANGEVTVMAQLWTTGAHPMQYGDPITFNLQVTDVTNGVMWVIAVGVLLTLLAGVRFYLQRKKRGSDGPDEDGDAPVEGAPQGGAPAADAPAVGAEDRDQTARNEKVGP
ncbi:DUF6049 family protein [Streptomyces sp. NPDC092296]|uniref:DUF6049 family protein n=1 Tax=Streptomyces sp. NPDC092296 TaxID=3366012 RepID=UPI003821207A